MSGGARPARGSLSALIVDDEPSFRESLEGLVGREGFAIRSAGTLGEARQELESSMHDVVLVDLKLPDGEGLELLRGREGPGGPEFVVVTGNASLDSAVEVLRAGALDYLIKPIDRGRLKAVLAHVARTRVLKAEVNRLRDELCGLGRFGRLVGSSPAMQQVYRLIQRVAPTDATVLITGDSGTGKELVAETIHDCGPRRDSIFLPLNCGAIPPTLIESELFGHERGSFTGADQTKKGYFERADGGTLFLDEITEMSAELQVKLLRVLETGQVRHIGGDGPIEVDVRVIAATNQDPELAVKEGNLREDIYYRLNVFPIVLPRLRDRGDDVRYLAQHFLEECNREMGGEKSWTRAALERLRSHPWPGNVRELKNFVQRAFILVDDEIRADALPLGDKAPVQVDKKVALTLSVGTSVAEAERRLILATLAAFDGDKKRASKTLGVSLKTLYSRLNVYKAGEESE